MRPPPRAILPSLVATLAPFGAPRALAALDPGTRVGAERGCSLVTIEPDAGFSARWPVLLDRIRGELTGRRDIESCARVELRLRDDLVEVFVRLPDGRSAVRSLASHEDVLPTLQALLLIPASERGTSRPRPAQPVPVTTRVDERVAHMARPERDAPVRPRGWPREFGVELSFISGARVGDGQFGVGAGALSFLEVRSWLIGFEGRADTYHPVRGGDGATALELGVLGGRRLDFGNLALDLTGGPAVAVKGIVLSETDVERVSAGSTPPRTAPAAESSSGPVPRLLLGARLGFSPRSVFRTFIGIDAEIGPARAVGPSTESSARMPGYVFGLAVGATVGTR